jgi:hypothetical protein
MTSPMCIRKVERIGLVHRLGAKQVAGIVNALPWLSEVDSLELESISPLPGGATYLFTELLVPILIESLASNSLRARSLTESD